MFDVDIPAYFTDRARKGWRDIGFACLAGSVVSYLGGSYASVGLAAATMLLPSIAAAIDANVERNGGNAPVSTSVGPGVDRARERRAFEASSFYRAINKVKAHLSFEDFVTEMANCSNLLGRRFSVTCIRIPGLTEGERAQVANLLRQTVRASDEIRPISDEDFLVCTPLLSDAKDADLVLNRLRRALLVSDVLKPHWTLRMGRALHPLDGYTGKDLMDSARKDLRDYAQGTQPQQEASVSYLEACI